jgi:DNA-binding CsgD family transcriptional regulator
VVIGIDATRNAPLIERADDLDRVVGLLDRAAEGHGSLVCLEGPPGIGKTALLTTVVGIARHRRMRVLHARGGELERDFSHGVVRALFESTMLGLSSREREVLLAGAAALAGPVVGLDEPTSSMEEHAVLHGLYWLCVNLTSGGPVLLVIDDAQWADAASLRFVVYLARRVRELPLLLLVAGRPAESDKNQMLLDAAVAAGDDALIRPAPLTAAGTREFLQGRFAHVELEFTHACHEVTAGNPFLLQELTETLCRDGITADRFGAQRVRELGPPSVSTSVRRRLQRLPSEAGRVARAVAVLGTATPQRHAAALAGLDISTAARCVDVLAAADILIPDEPLDFVHPLVRRVIYDAIPAGERSLSHARAASLLIEAGAAPESVAPHLLATRPSGDATIVDLLRRAASRSAERGDPKAAVTYLRRAVQEPPLTEVRSAVLRELGRAEVTAGDPEGVENLREALTGIDAAIDRAPVARELATGLVLLGRYTAAVDILERAIADLPDSAADLAQRVRAELVTVARLHPETYEISMRHGERLEEALSGGTLPHRDALASLALHRLIAGASAADVASLATQAVEDWSLGEGAVESIVVYDALAALWATDEVNAARRAHDTAVDSARRCGSLIAFARGSAFRAQLRYRHGALAEAEADARAALDVSEPAWPVTRMALGGLVEVLIDRGRLDEAEHALREYGGDGEIPFTFIADVLMWARVRLRAAQGRLGDTTTDLHEFERRERSWPGRCPVWFPYRSLQALTLLADGDPERARRKAAEEVDRARHWGTAAAEGQALRVLGLVSGGPSGLAMLHDAVAALARSPARLEHARAVTDLGAALRRTGQRAAARDTLAEGLDLASRCGAEAIASRAREELHLAGARPRRDRRTGVSALTASELRVARMARAGMTNREIAQALFVTLRAVQLHLTHVYRKLDITSREALGTALGDEEKLRYQP